MLEACIYCPTADRWASIVLRNGWYIAECDGHTRRCRDEFVAFGWAEWMLGRGMPRKAG